MLNFFNRRKLLTVASLIVATSAFAQDNNRPRKECFDQGLEMPMNQTMAGHSHHGRTEVRGSWDVWARGSYLYWQAREEGLDLGFVSNTATPITSPPAGLASQVSVEHPHFGFKSAFKVALGVNLDYDHWETWAEYTWFHGTVNTSLAGLPSGSFLYPAQGMTTTSILGTPTTNANFSSATQSWELKMDIIDLCLTRSHYSGAKLIFVPYFGARGALIRQTEFNDYDSSLNTLTIENKSISQGLGPRAGVNSKYQVGYGFRLMGDAGADILYTRYNYLFTQKMVTSGGAVAQNLKLQETRNDFLRAHADLELGVGWGSYFDNNNWFVDISATYGFQVFWNQNMFRNFTGSDGFDIAHSTIPNGNLYVHGVTANLKIDF
jgi:hypothetical protein